MAATIRRGVLLVEGDSSVSVAVQYRTQSTWRHAALCVRDATATARPPLLLEANVVAGVRTLPLDHYAHLHTRICRPYDLRHLADLARYLPPMPPVPRRFRRRMLALGSGDPTRAICSALIALSSRFATRSFRES